MQVSICLLDVMLANRYDVYLYMALPFGPSPGKCSRNGNPMNDSTALEIPIVSRVAHLQNINNWDYSGLLRIS